MRPVSRPLVLIFLALCLSTGCGRDAKQRVKFHQERALFGTFVQIDVCANSGDREKLEKVFEDVWARFEEINVRMSAHNPQSEVVGLKNYKMGEVVPISEGLAEVIGFSKGISLKTGGLFDVTVLPLIDVWKEAEKNQQEPSYAQIVSAGLRVGSDLIELVDQRSVRFLYSNMEIDLGGVAAGYAVDEAARIFRLHGFQDFFIDAGGDIYVAGHNLKGERWRIGIQHPRKPDELIDILSLSDQAVTTSGDYERFVEIDGKRFSHIINPHTGYPQTTNISATVIAPSTIEADAYATALMIWNPKEGVDCINGLGEGFAALVIIEEDGEGQFYQSHNYSSVQTEQKILTF